MKFFNYLFFLLNISLLYSQSDSRILTVKEKSFDKEKNVETIHYIDTTYYPETNILRYTGEFIFICKYNQKRCDSIPVNKWDYYDNEGKLVYTEIYNYKGKIIKINEFIPLGYNNYIINADFEKINYSYEKVLGYFHNKFDFVLTNKPYIVNGWNSVYNFSPPKIYNKNKPYDELDSTILEITDAQSGDIFAEIYLNKVYEDCCFTICPLRYLQGSLSRRLIKGKKYYFEFYIKHNPCSKMVSNNLCVFFSEHPVYINYDIILNLEPTYKIKDIIFADEWKKISFTFRAKGFYKYFIIGNFYSPKKTKFIYKNSGHSDTKCKKVNKNARYFLDNFCLIPLDYKDVKKISPLSADSLKKDTEINITKEDQLFNYDTLKVAVNQPVILEKIYFKFDSYELLSESLGELDKLYDFLIQNPELVIEISGHTDNIGKKKYNKWLSQKRAESVCKYLINKGIDSKRLIAKGYADDFPVVDSNNKIIPYKSRRVEFKIIKINK